MAALLEPPIPVPFVPIVVEIVESPSKTSAAEVESPDTKRRKVAVASPPSVLQPGKYCADLFDVSGEPYELGLHWDSETEEQSLKIDELIGHCHKQFFAEPEWVDAGPLAINDEERGWSHPFVKEDAMCALRHNGKYQSTLPLMRLA